MKNVIFLTVLAASVLNACHKPSQPHYTINASLKAAFDFQPGTYWIYKDSISGEVDSFAVQTSESGTSTNSSGGYSMDQIFIYIQEYFPSSGTSDYKEWEYSFFGDEIDLLYYGSNITETNYAPFINFPFQNPLTYETYAHEVGNIIDSSYVDNIYDSYSLLGNTFLNVAVVNHALIYLTAINYSDVFYICPNIGIIKMKLNHRLDSINRVWELQRWNVVM